MYFYRQLMKKVVDMTNTCFAILIATAALCYGAGVAVGWYIKKHKMKLIDGEYHQNLLNFNQWAIYSTKESQFKAKLKAVNQLGLLILKLENGKEKSYNLKEIIQVI